MSGHNAHGASYWEDNGVVVPSREDYVYHIEYNHIHGYGNELLSDFGAVKPGRPQK